MAGSRLGFAIGNEELIADMETLRYSTNPYNINRITLKCGEAAMDNDDYFANNCRLIAETRESTSRRLRQMGFVLTDSKANFLFASHPDFPGERLYSELKKRGILVRHFSAERISEYLRITVGTPSDMDALCAALEDIIKHEQ
jgi:histidinol-phosphate aminotransferase